MIIPKRDAKEYGAVHVDNYLSFVGFCKKVESNEPCEVKVYLDGKLIDTLKADKSIEKVEKIYDIKNHGFTFELDEKYFEKSHLLEFKINNDELLLNGTIKTIDKNNAKFNEYRFLHSLTLDIDEEEIKDLYCKDAIGFLAVEENLNDKDFVQYIKELFTKFPQVTFKAFYFNDSQKNIFKTLFKDYIERIDLIIPKNIYELTNMIEILISNVDTSLAYKNLYSHIYIFSNQIFINIFYQEYKNKIFKDFKPYKTHPFIQNNTLYNFTEQEIKEANYIVQIMIYNKIHKLLNKEKIKETDSVDEKLNIDRIRYILQSSQVKSFLISLMQKLYNNK